jgi:hypothetical protein
MLFQKAKFKVQHNNTRQRKFPAKNPLKSVWQIRATRMGEFSPIGRLLCTYVLLAFLIKKKT